MIVEIEFDHTWDEDSVKEVFEGQPGIVSVNIRHCSKCNKCELPKH